MAGIAYIDKQNEVLEKQQQAVSVNSEETAAEETASARRAAEEDARNTPILRRLKGLGPSYALFSALMVFEFVCLVPFNANLNLLLQTRFSLNSVQAGTIIVSPLISSIFRLSALL